MNTPEEYDALLRAADLLEDQRRSLSALRRHQRVLEERIARQRGALADLQFAHDQHKLRAAAYRAFVDETTMDEFLPIMLRVQRKHAALTEEQERERDRQAEWDALLRTSDEDECDEDGCFDCCDCAADPVQLGRAHREVEELRDAVQEAIYLLEDGDRYDIWRVADLLRDALPKEAPDA